MKPRSDLRRTAHPGTLVLVTLLGAVAASGCASAGHAVPQPFPVPSPPPARGPAPRPIPAPDAPGAPDTYSIVGTALSLRGTPYVSGGAGLSGFDCSGFVQYVFARHGIRVPRSVSEQFAVGDEIPMRELAPGDLLFFATKGSDASHVAIAIGGDRFVHSPSASGVVRVERFSARYWDSRLIGARRLVRGPAEAGY